MSLISAIIPAAGYGLRLKKGIPKALVKLDKKPLFIYSLEMISRHPDIDEIILVVPKKYLNLFKKKIKKYQIKKIKAIVKGGWQRQESVRNGLMQVSDKCRWVLIHDAVRPFINPEIISQVILAAKKYGAATAGFPISATLKSVDKQLFVNETLKRDSLWETQTPQVFKKELITEAHRKFKDQSFSDDAGMIEKLGIKVKMVKINPLNIKITYPEDLFLAEAILKYKKRYGL